jgi:hypothetical protein
VSLKIATVMFRLDPIGGLVLDEEVKGFNHGGHRGSRGKSANHKRRFVWRTTLVACRIEFVTSIIGSVEVAVPRGWGRDAPTTAAETAALR